MAACAQVDELLNNSSNEPVNVAARAGAIVRGEPLQGKGDAATAIAYRCERQRVRYLGLRRRSEQRDAQPRPGRRPS